MSNSTIRAALDDGPRVGEILEIEAGSGDGPPATLVVSDPFTDGPSVSTTYHLHQEGPEPGTYVYRTGVPDGSVESDDRGGSNDPDDVNSDDTPRDGAASDGAASDGTGSDQVKRGPSSEQLQEERMESEGGP